MLRRRHLLLRLLSLRAVVDQNKLYDLAEEEPLFIPFTENEVSVFVTNGFHASATTVLHYEAGSSYFFHVEAIVNNRSIIAMLIAALLFFAIYIFTGQVFLLILANLPILALVVVLFLFPSRSILLKPWQPPVTS